MRNFAAMKPQHVIISTQLEPALQAAVDACEHDRLFILTDETTRELCLPVVQHYACLAGATIITIGATDSHKTLDSLTHVWTSLQQGGATRHSLMVNLGGGMVTDLGGFAAATFKRGLNYINIPTTLLSMVDASVGGKTGINFGGLKNEVGVFSNASTVILDTIFLRTLDINNILSGYAEMLKHGLISTPDMLAQLLNFPILDDNALAQPLFSQMLADSVAVKQRIVEEDPTEQGLRKALNLGHTVGHAFEAFALAPLTSPLGGKNSSPKGEDRRGLPLLHGYAVAYGLICELYLSSVKCGFPTDRMHQVVNFIRQHYGRLAITCHDYPTLLQLMTHDKKNTAGEINFTLLGNVGDLRINQTATTQEIEQSLDFFQDCMG
jgi:3-dehydroquinate synthase